MGRPTLTLDFSPARLRDLRERSGLLVRDLAARAGIDPSALSRYENGKRTPTPAILIRLAHALKVEVDDLLADDSAVAS